MSEFSWNPFGEEQDENVLGPRRVPSAEQIDRQLEIEFSQIFPEGWLEKIKRDQGDEVGNG